MLQSLKSQVREVAIVNTLLSLRLAEVISGLQRPHPRISLDTTVRVKMRHDEEQVEMPLAFGSVEMGGYQKSKWQRDPSGPSASAGAGNSAHGHNRSCQGTT